MNGVTGKVELLRGRTTAIEETVEVEHEAEAPVDEAPIFGDHHYEHGPPDFSGGRPWITIGIATIAAAGWLVLVGLAASGAAGSDAPTPAFAAQWVAIACAPLALIGVIYLLLQRTSRTEARRFGRTAAALRQETHRLETALSLAARQIDDNRASLAHNIAELVARSDEASRSLSGINTTIAAEGEAIQRHSATLKNSATAARADMTALLASLPKAHTHVIEMAAALRDAGSDVHQRAGALDSLLETLGTRGRETDSMIGGAAERLGAHLARIDTTSEAAGDRLTTAAGQMTDAVDAALAKAAEAVDAARQSMEAQAEAMRALVEQSQVALERTGADSVQAMHGRLAEMGMRLEALGGTLAAQDAASRAMLERLGQALGEVDERLAALDASGTERAERLSGALAGLQTEAERTRLALEAGGATADDYRTKVEALLLALDSSAREIDETLPAAFGRLGDHSREAQATLGAIAPEVDRFETATGTALQRLTEAETLLSGQNERIASLLATSTASLEDGRRHVDSFGEAIDATDARLRGLSQEAAPLLIDALLRVRETANQAAERARTALGAVIPEATDRLGADAAEALRRTLAERIEAQIGEVAATAERALGSALAASERLSQQVRTISDTSASLEARIAEARAEAEEADHDNFARRVVLLIESLNSTAIDVTKILSQDVSDSAWAAYLKGERGVFARRAVRLLDGGEVREIASRHENDREFREQVNRYIHDFESMLRMVLATRDGSALGVTLLSSDNGKLYVALAQAIERLR